MVKLNRCEVLVFLSLLVALTMPIGYVSAEENSSIESKNSTLFDNLLGAKTEQDGRIAEDAVWQFWFSRSPTAEIRAHLDAGIERREAYDFEAAEAHFDKVVQLAPSYAEGFNQRAFIRFLRQNYDEAKIDLEIVLTLEPKHFGALSGLYHILLIQNKRDEALSMLRRAVEIHPWLKERSLLPKAMWPRQYRNLHAPGTDI